MFAIENCQDQGIKNLRFEECKIMKRAVTRLVQFLSSTKALISFGICKITFDDAQDFKKLINFLTIYHGQVAIPKFKIAKSKMYLKMLNTFCVKEISNAHLTATLFHSLLELGNKE